MSTRRETLFLLLLLALTAAVYWHGLNGPFLFDDFSNIPLVQIDSLDPVAIKDAALANTSGRLRRPVANLSFAFNGYFLGQSSLSYKSVNLLIHLACGWVLFLLVRRMVEIANRKRAGPDPGTVALIAAGFWLLHPIQVSTVLYVVQRMAQLSTLFAFMAVLGWVRWRTSLEEGSWRRSIGWLCLVGMCALLSLLSKESGALIPLLLLVVEACLFRFRPPPAARGRWLLVNGLLIGIPLAFGLLYTIAHWHGFVAGYGTRPFNMGERLLTEIHAIWHYIRLIFAPSLAVMGLYYDEFPITHSLDVTTIALGLGLVALLALGVAMIKRHPVLGLGILWFFAGHALESTFIGLEPAFEHRNYLPLLGPAMILGYYLPLLVRRAGELRRPVIALVALLGLVITGLSVARVDSWSSREAFLKTQVRHHPTSFRVNLDLVNVSMQARQWDQALQMIEAIHRQHPDNPTWPLLRLFVACGRGELPANWLPEARDVMRQRGVSRASVLAIQALTGRKLKDICPAVSYPEMQSLVDAALEDPLIQRSTTLKSLLLLQRARLYVLSGDIPLATNSYMDAWRADPGKPTPLLDLANLQIALGQFGEAEETISVLEQIARDKPLDIGETAVSDLKARLREKRVSSDQTKPD